MLVDEGVIVGTETEGKKLFELTEEGRDAAEKIATPPWQEITEGIEPGHRNLRAAVGQLFGAVAQSAHTASPEQQQRIVDIVNNARREIYQILGESGNRAAGLGRGLDLHPVQRALHRLAPAGATGGAAPRSTTATTAGSPANWPAGHRDPPRSRSPARRRVRRPERRRLGHHRAHHVDAQHIGLDLHAQLVERHRRRRRHTEVHTGVGLHRIDHIAALVADRLQRRRGHVRIGIEARQPDDRPAASDRQYGANSPENAGTK